MDSDLDHTLIVGLPAQRIKHTLSFPSHFPHLRLIPHRRSHSSTLSNRLPPLVPQPRWKNGLHRRSAWLKKYCSFSRGFRFPPLGQGPPSSGLWRQTVPSSKGSWPVVSANGQSGLLLGSTSSGVRPCSSDGLAGPTRAALNRRWPNSMLLGCLAAADLCRMALSWSDGSDPLPSTSPGLGDLRPKWGANSSPEPGPPSLAPCVCRGQQKRTFRSGSMEQ